MNHQKEGKTKKQKEQKTTKQKANTKMVELNSNVPTISLKQLIKY